MESIPLLYQIIFIIIINTILVAIIDYLLCKRKVKKEIMSSISQLNETHKVKKENLELGRMETEKPYQRPVSKVEDKNSHKQFKDKKNPKYLRYTLSGYVNIEEDKDKKKSKWR